MITIDKIKILVISCNIALAYSLVKFIISISNPRTKKIITHEVSTIMNNYFAKDSFSQLPLVLSTTTSVHNIFISIRSDVPIEIPIETILNPHSLAHCTTLLVPLTFHPASILLPIQDQRRISNTIGTFVQQIYALILPVPLTHQAHPEYVNTVTCYDQSYVQPNVK